MRIRTTGLQAEGVISKEETLRIRQNMVAKYDWWPLMAKGVVRGRTRGSISTGAGNDHFRGKVRGEAIVGDWEADGADLFLEIDGKTKQGKRFQQELEGHLTAEGWTELEGVIWWDD